MQNEQGILKLPCTALQRAIFREESRKTKSDSDRSIFYPENPVPCPSVTSYLSQRTLKRCSLLTALQPWNFFSKLFSLYCHAKQILPWFQSSGWAGRGRAPGWAVLHSPVTQTLPTEQAHVGPAVYSQVQAPFQWVTADDHLEQLNSMQSAHFLSKMFFFRSIWKASSLFLSTWDRVLCWSWRVLNRLYQEVQHRAVNSGTLFHLKGF